MIKLTQKHQKIINIFLQKGRMQSSDVHTELVNRGENISLVSVKRALTENYTIK